MKNFMSKQKIDTLIEQMTLDEKMSLLAGADMWHTAAVERLGIPAVQVSDGPNGVRGSDDNLGETSICFPVGVAMGATWNPALIEAVGEALAAQMRQKGAHVLLAPTVNIHRTPIAGRNFECFAEDPFLSGIIASSYINGLQKHGVAACIKHFVANDQEFERFSISSEVDERSLHEIYLEPFRLAHERVNPWSVMSAYNRINGIHASENDLLLKQILKETWGYDGVVMSDWYGTYSDNVPAGALDLEMPGPARWMTAEKIQAALDSGALEMSALDDKVRRLLRLIERVTRTEKAVPTVDDTLPRQVAAESVVLLKNDGDILPLNPDQAQKIAVIGENGKWAKIMGGGSSQVNPHRAVSPLTGIEERVGPKTTVSYTLGTPLYRMPPLFNPAWMTHDDGQPGLKLAYFHNLDLEGEPAVADIVTKSELTWFGTVNPFVDPTCFSLRLTGQLTVPEDGRYTLHIWAIGRSRLIIDGSVVIDQWAEAEDQQSTAEVDLIAGRPVDLTVEYATNPDAVWRTLRLGYQPLMASDPIKDAVALAREADTVVLVAGLNREWESEGFDRVDMRLPGKQDELIERVAAVNPRTVVVLNAGSPLEMPWVDDVAVVVQQWYGGQDAGHGLADVLFGDVNPSGKLPTTFPRRLQDNPAYINYPGENGRVRYGEGVFVGYRYYDKKEIEPLFPFGHGLSYTTFHYDNFQVNQEEFAPGDTIEVQVDITNSGSTAGQEVVQLYLRHLEPRLVRPPQELKGFAKVALQPGETKTVTIPLNERSLAFYDPAAGRWVTESGVYEVRIGASSRDIHQSGQIRWRAPELENREETPVAAQQSTVPT